MKMSDFQNFKLRWLVIPLLLIFMISSCGQRPADVAATGPDQIAEAASPTATTTNTAIPTDTPTPTPTPLPTMTPTPEPTPVGGGGLITFASDRDGNFEIYLMNPDGSDQTRLTNRPTNEYKPEISPDGKIVVYHITDLQSDPPISEYHAMGVDGTDYGLLIGGPMEVTWAPDGNGLALSFMSEPKNLDIFTIQFGEEAQQLTTNPAWDQSPAWSPDGNTIAFVSFRDGSPQIFLMDSDGSNQRGILEDGMVGYLPAWSPDGTKIAFTSGDNVNTNIYIMNIDGTEIFQVTDSHGYNENPAWSPDGTMLVFWSNRSGTEQIYRIRTDGTELTRLTNNEFNDEDPHWSSAPDAN